MSTTPLVIQFMSQVLFTLQDDLKLTDAARLFATNKLTTIPVVDKGGEILGVLTDFQLLRFLIAAKTGAKDVPLSNYKNELDPVITIQEKESIVDAFRLMIQSPNHRIYATRDGQLTGALSPKDLLLYMAGFSDTSEHTLDDLVAEQIQAILTELYDTRRLLSDYQQMFQDAPYLMHSVDMSGTIVAANRMIHFVLGYEEGELVGQSMRQLYPPENYHKALKGLDTVRALGFHPLVNVVMVKKDGDTVRADISSTLKTGASGQPEGTITVGRLSDSYRMLDYLQRASQLRSS